MAGSDEGAESPRLSKAIYLSLIALFVFSFVSKAGINIFGGVAYLMTLALLWRTGLRRLRDDSWWYFIVTPLLVGLLTSSFTAAGGLEETGHFLTRFKFFLLPLVIVLVARDKKAFLGLFVAVWVSALIATLYGLSQAEQRVLGGFHGVHFILRNADMLVVVVLTMLVFLLDKEFRSQHRKWVWLMLPSLALFSYGLVMSAARGAWLGFFIGAVAYGVLFCRRLLVAIFLVAIVIIGIASESRFMDEARSISDVSHNHSNSARLQLWQSGWDFSLNHFWLGAGHSQVEPLFLEHFNQQPAAYQERYALATQYPWDFHNSYLQILVEWGALYCAVLMACGALLFYRLYRSLDKVSSQNRCYVQAAIVVSVGYLVAQFFHNELYGYGTAIYLLLLAAGLVAVRWQTYELEN